MNTKYTQKKARVKKIYKQLIIEYYVKYIVYGIYAVAFFGLPILAILHMQGYINIF